MYIKREPLGKGGLSFRKRRRRLPVIAIVLYLLILGTAVYVFLHLDEFQPKVMAMVGPEPTATPAASEYLAQAEARYLDGDLTGAADSYRQALELEPENIDVMYELSRILTLTAQLDPLLLEEQTTVNLDDARAIADDMILLAPEDPRGHAAKSRALDYLGDPQQAAVEAIRAIELDANFAIGHAYLAEAYADLYQLRQAREAAQRAIELDPFNVDARRNYAYVLEFYGDYGGAVQQYLQAIQLHNNLLDLWYGLARNYRASGEIEKAVETYGRIITRTPDDPRPYTELGRTYYEIRDDDAAQSTLQSAVALVCDQTQTTDGSNATTTPVEKLSCPRMTYEELARNNYDYDSALLPDEIYEPAWRRLGLVFHTRRNYEDAVAIFEEMVAYYAAQDQKAPIEAYVVLSSAYYYIDQGPDDQPLCDRAIHYADEGLDIYELTRMDDPIILQNLLKVFVLCRDYALTPPSTPVQFPRGYEEPDVIVQRAGNQVTVEDAPDDGSEDGDQMDANDQ